MRYICYFNALEWVTGYDIAEKRISVSDLKYKAMTFENEGAAAYIANKFGCYYEEIGE